MELKYNSVYVRFKDYEMSINKNGMVSVNGGSFDIYYDNSKNSNNQRFTTQMRYYEDLNDNKITVLVGMYKEALEAIEYFEEVMEEAKELLEKGEEKVEVTEEEIKEVDREEWDMSGFGRDERIMKYIPKKYHSEVWQAYSFGDGYEVVMYPDSEYMFEGDRFGTIAPTIKELQSDLRTLESREETEAKMERLRKVAREIKNGKQN